MCTRDPLEVNGMMIGGAGGVAGNKAYTVHAVNIISERQYFVAPCLIPGVGNVFDLHSICVLFPSTLKLVTWANRTVSPRLQ